MRWVIAENCTEFLPFITIICFCIPHLFCCQPPIFLITYRFVNSLPTKTANWLVLRVTHALRPLVKTTRGLPERCSNQLQLLATWENIGPNVVRCSSKNGSAYWYTIFRMYSRRLQIKNGSTYHLSLSSIRPRSCLEIKRNPNTLERERWNSEKAIGILNPLISCDLRLPFQ